MIQRFIKSKIGCGKSRLFLLWIILILTGGQRGNVCFCIFLILNLSGDMQNLVRHFPHQVAIGR